jgi:aspartyl-tRNA(Asn)/glutamyl-tRNA(Gln) amidotransferase subunit A
LNYIGKLKKCKTGVFAADERRTMTDLVRQSLGTIARLIEKRELSPVEVVEAHLERIARLNPALNAIVTVAPDVMERARTAEDAVMRGDKLGALHGVPITVKDTIETAGLRTTSGSRIRAHYVPEGDAPAVARLKAAGAIILGIPSSVALIIR